MKKEPNYKEWLSTELKLAKCDCELIGGFNPDRIDCVFFMKNGTQQVRTILMNRLYDKEDFDKIFSEIGDMNDQMVIPGVDTEKIFSNNQ